MPSTSNLRGRAFENRVRALLLIFCSHNPTKVTVFEQDTVRLQNGQIVIPDFRLRVHFPHEVRHFVIECQARKKSSNDVANKFLAIKTHSHMHTMFFLHEWKLAEPQRAVLENSGVNVFSLETFALYLFRMDMVMNPGVGRDDVAQDYQALVNVLDRDDPAPGVSSLLYHYLHIILAVDEVKSRNSRWVVYSLVYIPYVALIVAVPLIWLLTSWYIIVKVLISVFVAVVLAFVTRMLVSLDVVHKQVYWKL